MREIEVKEIVVEALPGAHIEDCVKAAIVLAATEWRNVRLRHNGIDYTISLDALYAACEQEKD